MPDRDKTPPLIDPPGEERELLLPHLIVLHGDGVGAVHRVTGREAILGRDADADIRIEHPTVSGRHARILVLRESVFIEDLGSTNGTLVGIHPVRGRTSVPDGAVISLGRATLLKLTHAPVLGESLSRKDTRHPTSDRSARVASLLYLRDQLRGECAYARRHQSPLTIVTVRADQIDAEVDEPRFDSVMGELAITIYEATRDEDILARSSHNEFMVLLRADAEQSRTMAERIRARVVGARVVGGLGSAIGTVTCAVLPLGKTALASPEELIDWAVSRAWLETSGVRGRVLRLTPLESPSMPRRGPV